MKKIILAAVITFISSSVLADTASMYAKVTRTFLADEGRWGGCMAALGVGINAETGLNCAGEYVSFSCSGTHLPKDIAYRMYDVAQMSWVLDKNIQVEIDDSKKHNGYCVAKRIDILR